MKYIRRYKHKFKLKKWNTKLRKQNRNVNYRFIFYPYTPIYTNTRLVSNPLKLKATWYQEGKDGLWRNMENPLDEGHTFNELVTIKDVNK